MSGFFEVIIKIEVRPPQRSYDIRGADHEFKFTKQVWLLRADSLSGRVKDSMRAVPHLLPESSLGKALLVGMVNTFVNVTLL